MGKKKEKKALDKQKVGRQAGGVSKLILNEGEEALLVDLLTMLDGGQKYDQKLVNNIRNDDDNNGEDDDGDDDEDSSSGDENNESDKEQQEEESSHGNQQLNEKQRAEIVLRLIRDERKASKGELIEKAAIKVARKQTLDSMSKTSTITSSDTDADMMGVLQLQNKIAKNESTPQVRMSVSCQGKGIKSKLLVVDRDLPLEDVILIARNKFNAGKKMDCLVYASDPSCVLEDDVLMTLENDESVILTSKTLVVPPTLTITHHDDHEEDDDEDVANISSVENINILKDEGPSSAKEVIEAIPADPIPVWSVANIEKRTFSENYIASPRRVDPVESEILRQQLLSVDYSDRRLEDLRNIRETLPIFSVKEEILSQVTFNQVCVISGETGSGKTTQTTQYIYEDMVMNNQGSEAYIICTQPRRIAAISVAERVAYERGESVGETVGYQVRLNSKISSQTRILYCTTGVLLRKLHQKDMLSSVSHIFIDEVHERQVESDFLMAFLKQQLHLYPHLRVILMSATLQEQLYCNYFSCPVVYVSGRTFPVDIHYLNEIHSLVAAGQRVVAEARGKPGRTNNNHGNRGNHKQSPADSINYHLSKGNEVSSLKLPRFDPELIAEIVIRIIERYSSKTLIPAVTPAASATGDAILVFLSGIQSIDKVNRALRSRNLVSLNAVCFTLHGSLPAEYQRKVFQKTEPGDWKIILSTNIAETSVTIDDVTHVVDCGLLKEMRYDASVNISSLKEVYVSRAAARQRSGRAGRVRPGHAWRVYTEEFFTGKAVDDFPIPEVKRIPLEEVVLQVLLLELGYPESFLKSCIEPPSQEQVRRSVFTLLEIKAVLPRPTLPLTALGYHLARLPVDVRLGKMLIVGSLLNCIEPILTIAAALGGKSPFVSPMNQRDQATAAHRRFSRENKFSDHLAIVTAYNQWMIVRETQGKPGAFKFCQDHYLASNSLEEIHLLREHFRHYLVDAGFLPKSRKTSQHSAGVEVGEGLEDSECLPVDDEEMDEEDGGIDARKADIADELNIEEESEAVNNEIVRCALTAGLFPQIVRVARYINKEKGKAGKKGLGRQDLQPIHIVQADQKEVYIHPISLTGKELPTIFDYEGGKRKEAYIAYYTKVASTKIFLHDCTFIPIPAILLFGGDLVIAKSRDRVLVDGWIHMKASELHAVLYKRLQKEIEFLLIKKVENPEEDISARQNALVKVLSKLLE